MKRSFLAVAVPALALAACTTSETLDPSAIQPPQVRAPEVAAPPPEAETPQPQAPARAASVHFAAVVGATETASAPLAARLSALAAERGIAAQGEGTAELVLRGYFSAFTENRQTTVIYVWDVLDRSGSRLHRIQGQQREGESEGEGWSAVSGRTMEAIADQTISQLSAWLSTRPG